MNTVSLDGTHSPVKKGGESVGYDKKKKCKTSNMLAFTDSQGLGIAFGKPVAGNQHDLFKIKELFKQFRVAKVATDGLFLNADAGFDADILVKIRVLH